MRRETINFARGIKRYRDVVVAVRQSKCTKQARPKQKIYRVGNMTA